MLFRSFEVIRLFGIPVRVHGTLVVFLLLMAHVFNRASGFQGYLATLAILVAFYGCVLLHEFGHTTAAARFGISTRRITLTPIGGLAMLERLPSKPAQELVVYFAGPLVNLVIALALGLVRVFTESALVSTFLWGNVALAVFNLLPAFPLDGGRVLRALLSFKLDYLQATEVAVRVGQVFALLFAIVGFFLNPMLIFIAVFVAVSAQTELMAVRMRFRPGQTLRSLYETLAARQFDRHAAPPRPVEDEFQAPGDEAPDEAPDEAAERADRVIDVGPDGRVHRVWRRSTGEDC